MAAEDNNITAAARRILSSYWVDLTRMHVRTTRGTIYISGTFKRMTFEHAEMDERMLRQIDSDLKMLDKVRAVIYDLVNWELDAMDVWRRVDSEEQKSRKRRDSQWDSSGM